MPSNFPAYRISEKEGNIDNSHDTTQEGFHGNITNCYNIMLKMEKYARLVNIRLIVLRVKSKANRRAMAKPKITWRQFGYLGILGLTSSRIR